MFFPDIMNAVVEKAENLCGCEVPVVSAIAIDGNIVSMKNNEVECKKCSYYHAEFLAVEEALKLVDSKYLETASIYVTIEPCAFCSALLERVRIKDIFFGAYDPKCGGIYHNAKIFDYSLFKPNIIGGIQEERCAKILERFFKDIRSNG